MVHIKKKNLKKSYIKKKFKKKNEVDIHMLI